MTESRTDTRAMQVMQVDGLRSPAWQPSWDLPLTMYHDETNNPRRLRLRDVGLNAPADKVFALGGIAMPPGKHLTGWPELRKELRIQPSAKEVKFDLVAPSDYEGALASPKLAKVLHWLIASDVLLHYSLLDVLHWSILDIVESLQADPRLSIDEIHGELKNELYFAVSIDPGAFMTLLHGFGYPDLKRAEVRPFLNCVLSFVKTRAPKNRSAATRLLKQLLHKASKLRGLELVFLHDNEPGELIQDFSVNFMHALCIFKNAKHVLDEETVIQERLQHVELRDGDRRLDYRFADSVDEIGIQAADIVMGLIGRHFTYVQQRTLPELRAALSRYTAQQHKTLALLRELIDRSDGFSNGLLHAVTPMDTQYKNTNFLFGKPAPEYLG